MASKRRKRRKQCTGKIRHKSEADAYGHLRKLKGSSDSKAREYFNIYRCTFCGGFHVGHPPKPKRRRL